MPNKTNNNLHEQNAEREQQLDAQRKILPETVFNLIGPLVNPPARHSLEKQLKKTDYQAAPGEEEWITAIICGAIMDEKNMAECSAGGVKALDYMLMNVFAAEKANKYGARDRSYDLAVLHGRQDALQALKNREDRNEKGEKTDKAKKAEADLARYAANFKLFAEKYLNIHNLGTLDGAESITVRAMLRLYNNVKDKNLFKETKISDPANRKLAEKLKVAQLRDQYLEMHNKYKDLSADKYPKADTKDRRELVKSALVAHQLSRLVYDFYQNPINHYRNKKYETDYYNEKYCRDELLPALSSKFGKKGEKYTPDELMSIWYSGSVITVLGNAVEEIKNGQISYQTKMLEDPTTTKDYLDRLTNIIINESKTYKDLVEMEDGKQCQERIEAIFKQNLELDFGGEKSKEDDIGNFPIKNLYLDPKAQEADQKENLDHAIAEVDQAFESESNQREMMDNLESAIEKDNSLDQEQKQEQEQKQKKMYAAYQQAVKGAGIWHISDNSLYRDDGVFQSNTDKKSFENDIASKLLSGKAVILKDGHGVPYRFTASEDEMTVDVAKVDYLVADQASLFAGTTLFDFNRDLAESHVIKTEAEQSSLLLNLSAYADIMANSMTQVDMPPIMSDFYQKVQELDELLAPHKETENYVFQGRDYVRYVHEISQAELNDLVKKCEECIEAGQIYQRRYPYDTMTEKVVKLIQGDLAVYKQIDLKNGAMPLNTAYHDINSKLIEQQNNIMKTAKNPKVYATGYRNLYCNKIIEAAAKDYINKNAEVYIYPDGVVRSENNYYFDRNGKKLENYQIGDFVSEHVAELEKYMKSHYVGRQEYSVVEYNSERLTALCKKLNPDYVAPDPDEQASRQIKAETYDHAYYQASMKWEIEKVIASGNQNVPREIQAFYRMDGTKESREWNRNLTKLACSENVAEKEQAYRICLQELRNINLNDYDFRKEEFFMEQPEKWLRFDRMFQEIGRLFDEAKLTGIDVDGEDYDELRTTVPTIASISNAAFARWVASTNPAYACVDLNQLEKCDAKMLQDLMTQLSEAQPEEYTHSAEYSFLTSLEMWANNNEMAKYALYDRTPDRTVADIVKNAKTFHKYPLVHEDGPVADLRRQLEDNVRRTRKGEVIANSPFYTAVTRALDDYLLAPIKDKEAKRLAIVTACNSYIAERSAGKERTQLIMRVRDFAASEEFKAKTEQLRNERAAKQMLDHYKQSLETGKAANKLNRSDKDMLEYLQAHNHEPQVISGLTKMDECRKCGLSPWNADCDKWTKDAFKKLERSLPFIISDDTSLLGEAVNVFKEQHDVKWDESIVFDQDGLKIDTQFTLKVLKKNREIYIRNTEGGFDHLQMVTNADGLLKLQAEPNCAIPLRSYQEMSEAGIVYQADLAAAEACMKGEKVDIEHMRNLSEYCNVFLSATDKIQRQLPTNVANLVSAVRNLQTEISRHTQLAEQEIGDIQEMAYPNMSGKEYADLVSAYEEVNRMAGAIPKTQNPSFAGDFVKYCQKDLEVLKQLALQDGGMSLATALENWNTKALDRQIDYYAEILQSEKAGASPSEVLAAQIGQVIDNICFEQAKVAKTPDGVYKKFGAHYLNGNGSVMNQGEVLENISSYDKTNIIEQKCQEFFYSRGRDAENTLIIGEIKVKQSPKKPVDFEKIQAALRYANEDYDKANMKKSYLSRRRKDETNFEDTVFKNMAQFEIENRIARKGLDAKMCRKIPKYMSAFLDMSGTPEARKQNQELYRQITSTQPDEQREAYRTCISKINDIMPQELRISADDSCIKKKSVNEIQKFMQVQAISNLLEDATAKKVSLDGLEYKNLRQNAGVLQSIGDIYKKKLDAMLTDAYHCVETSSEFASLKQDKIDTFSDSDVYNENRGDVQFNKMVKAVFDYATEAHNNAVYQLCIKPENDAKTMDAIIADARKATPNLSLFVPENPEFFQLYKELRGNKRHTRSGEEIANSEYYKNVLKAMKQYRDAEPEQKEARREAIISRCQEYLGRKFIDRANDRGQLILRIQTYAQGKLQETTQKFYTDEVYKKEWILGPVGKDLTQEEISKMKARNKVLDQKWADEFPDKCIAYLRKLKKANIENAPGKAEQSGKAEQPKKVEQNDRRVEILKEADGLDEAELKKKIRNILTEEKSLNKFVVQYKLITTTIIDRLAKNPNMTLEQINGCYERLYVDVLDTTFGISNRLLGQRLLQQYDQLNENQSKDHGPQMGGNGL